MKVLTIFGELASSKNSKQIVKRGNRPFLIKSKFALLKEAELELELYRLKPTWDANFAPLITIPQLITIKCYRATNRRFDYNNVTQLLFDCMVKAGYFVDDSAKYLLYCTLPHELDRQNPRTEITLLDINKIIELMKMENKKTLINHHDSVISVST